MTEDITEDWLSDYLKRCVETITKYGHMVQYVGGDQRENIEPLAYTIGLTDNENHGYELALTGLDPETARNVLNAAAHALIKTTPEDGLMVEGVLIGYVIRLRRATGGLDDFATLRKLYPHATTVWQVEYPDSRGNFPGDPEYDLHEGKQQQL